MTIEELSKLSDEELRVRCAELHRPEYIILGEHFHFIVPGKDVDQELKQAEKIPNYPADLNAIHEAESRITLSQRYDYQNTLARIAEKGRMAERGWLVMTATARQRCIAFIAVMQSQ